jgi:cytochrome c peroxidase
VQSRTGILDSTHPTQARMATSLAFAVAPGLSTIDTATHMHKMEPAQNNVMLDPSAPTANGPVDFPPAILTTNMTADCQNIGHPPGMDSPSSLVADALGEWIFVADHNSNAVAVVSSTRRQDDRYADPQRGIAGLVRVGARPTGIAVAGDLRHAYVHNALDGTISVIENSGGKLVVTATIPFATSGLPSDVERGRRLFYSAVDPRVTQPELGGVSCSSCHPNGRTDALSWTLPAAAQSNGWNWQPTNLPVRNTPALWGVTKTAPYHWDGSAQDLSAFSTTMVQQMGGVGVTTDDLSDLNAYMATLSPPDNPNAGAQASGLVARGQAIFAQRCQSCHAGDMLTDDKTHQVMATDVSELDTPSLRGVFSTAPYLHDGSAATLRDVVRGSRPTVTEHDVRSLPEADVSALEAFLQAQ